MSDNPRSPEPEEDSYEELPLDAPESDLEDDPVITPLLQELDRLTIPPLSPETDARIKAIVDAAMPPNGKPEDGQSHVGNAPASQPPLEPPRTGDVADGQSS